jgi:hypothetical protein
LHRRTAFSHLIFATPHLHQMHTQTINSVKILFAIIVCGQRMDLSVHYLYRATPGCMDRFQHYSFQAPNPRMWHHGEVCGGIWTLNGRTLLSSPSSIYIACDYYMYAHRMSPFHRGRMGPDIGFLSFAPYGMEHDLEHLGTTLKFWWA